MVVVAEELGGEAEAWEVEGEDVVTETILLLDRRSELPKDLIKVRILRRVTRGNSTPLENEL